MDNEARKMQKFNKKQTITMVVKINASIIVVDLIITTQFDFCYEMNLQQH